MLGRLLHWLFDVPPKVEYREIIKEVPVVKEVEVIKEVVKEVPTQTEEPVSEDVSAFKVDNVRIYAYFNGSETIKCDPMIIYKRWAEKSGDLDVDLKVARFGEKGADEAYEKALEKVRWIFNVRPLAEGGLDEQTTLELFFHFLRYVEAVKKNSQPLPTLSPITGPPPKPSLVES
mgnify:CR=1 FL=1